MRPSPRALLAVAGLPAACGGDTSSPEAVNRAPSIVEDPDVDDVLRGRWYLGDRTTAEAEQHFTASGEVIRDTYWTFDLEPCGRHRVQLNEEFVRLEALVGDREIENREVLNDGLTDSVIWTLRIDQEVVCPPPEGTE